ncbi:hypothetical protein AVEN_223896-1 [Araneus ventricosus]|uniref:Uncharacterized protein n=1 Tax=Araneus ventricosus TaxID=182803 RepID=A0A4Y2PCS2_ARAVE|nr:hypothetical protein AVEN_223896-1 [Araneus ventricosus]
MRDDASLSLAALAAPPPLITLKSCYESKPKLLKMDSHSRNVRMEIKNEDLPVDFKNVIVENFDSLIIRSSIKSIMDINSWVTEFGRKTNTNWNSRDSCPSGQRFACW